MIGAIGWMGSFLLALCGLPQAYTSWRQGHSRGINKLFLAMWFFGEIDLLIFTCFRLGWVPQLIVNYALNILILGVIFYYIFKPRSGS